MTAALNAAEIVALIEEATVVETADVVPVAAAVVAEDVDAAAPAAVDAAVSAAADTAEAATNQAFLDCVVAGDSPALFKPKQEGAAIKHRGLSCFP